MEKYRYESKVEEGILENACKDLELTPEEVVYRVHEEKGGLLKGKKYIIELMKLTDICEYGKNLLEEMLSALNINAQVETRIRDNQIKYDIHSENNSILIGKRGHILESIQTYVRQAIFTYTDFFVNISVDVENYKGKQIYFLEKNVKRVAREVTLSKLEVKLDPMNSYERKIVHDALSGFKYITSESVGEEPNRCVVIKYKGSEK
jgi:spoIIIJ-associated protein